MLPQQPVIDEIMRRKGARGMQALAMELGLSTPYLYDICTGRRAPGRKVLERLGWLRTIRISYGPADER